MADQKRIKVEVKKPAPDHGERDTILGIALGALGTGLAQTGAKKIQEHIEKVVDRHMDKDNHRGILEAAILMMPRQDTDELRRRFAEAQSRNEEKDLKDLIMKMPCKKDEKGNVVYDQLVVQLKNLNDMTDDEFDEMMDIARQDDWKQEVHQLARHFETGGSAETKKLGVAAAKIGKGAAKQVDAAAGNLAPRIRSLTEAIRKARRSY